MLDILILLTAALALEALAERLGQNAILGYLLAGTALGPNATDLLRSHDTLVHVAELGVVLLLFAIGLEFSWDRLKGLGRQALGSGAYQKSYEEIYAGRCCPWRHARSAKAPR